MFKKGDIIVKVGGARLHQKAIVIRDQMSSDDCISINYGYEKGINDPDYSPLSFCQLFDSAEYDMD